MLRSASNVCLADDASRPPQTAAPASVKASIAELVKLRRCGTERKRGKHCELPARPNVLKAHPDEPSGPAGSINDSTSLASLLKHLAFAAYSSHWSLRYRLEYIYTFSIASLNHTPIA